MDVFVQAWLERDHIDPNADFAPWLGGIAAARAGRSSEEVDDIWSVAMAIEALGPEGREALRAHHIENEELAEDADRHELRLRRRLAHLGDDATVARALSEPRPWADPDEELAERVRSRLGAGGAAAADSEDLATGSGDSLEFVDPIGEVRPGRVARSLRPVLLGLAGAITVLFVAIIALSAASGSPDPIAFTADLTPTGAILDVEGGELSVTERDNGLLLDLNAPTLPRRAGDQYYEGVLVLQDGTELTAGTFNQGFDVTLAGGASLDRVTEFLVVARTLGSADGDVILKLDVPRN